MKREVLFHHFPSKYENLLILVKTFSLSQDRLLQIKYMYIRCDIVIKLKYIERFFTKLIKFYQVCLAVGNTDYFSQYTSSFLFHLRLPSCTRDSLIIQVATNCQSVYFTSSSINYITLSHIQNIMVIKSPSRDKLPTIGYPMLYICIG